MDDLISRQAAIEVIDAVFPVDPMKSEYAQGIACGAALAKTYVEQLPSAKQWIPCSERLPEEEKDVLACTEIGEMVVAYPFSDWGDRLVWTTGAFGSGEVDVIAWMPLPEPYKGEANG